MEVTIETRLLWLLLGILVGIWLMLGFPRVRVAVNRKTGEMVSLKLVEEERVS